MRPAGSSGSYRSATVPADDQWHGIRVLAAETLARVDQRAGVTALARLAGDDELGAELRVCAATLVWSTVPRRRSGVRLVLRRAKTDTWLAAGRRAARPPRCRSDVRGYAGDWLVPERIPLAMRVE
jgi:hypothetical protein